MLVGMTPVGISRFDAAAAGLHPDQREAVRRLGGDVEEIVRLGRPRAGAAGQSERGQDNAARQRAVDILSSVTCSVGRLPFFSCSIAADRRPA